MTKFEWNRSDVLALARESCTHCRGFGLRRGKNGPSAPCHCVLRNIFRACFRKFRAIATEEKHVSAVRLEQTNGTDKRYMWGMKNEEFMADFCLVARRTLDAQEHQIFRFHFLLGADWKLCTRRLKMDRGNFFHAVYRIESKLGRQFREMQPYGLFPLDEYFTTGYVNEPVKASVIPMPERRKRLLPPLKKVA